MSSLTPLQLRRLMTVSGASPSLVASYGQQAGVPFDDILRARSAAVAPPTIPGIADQGITYTSIPDSAPYVPPPQEATQVQAPETMPPVTPQAPVAPDYGSRIGGAASRFSAASKAYANQVRELAKKNEALIDEQSTIKAKRDFELAGVESKRQAAADEAVGKMEAAQAAEDAVVGKVKNEMASLYADYKKSADIDPDKFVKEQSTGGAIMSALSMVLGGVGSGMSGGPNRASETIHRRIDNDIRAQIEKRNGLRDLIAEKRSELGDARAEKLGIVNMVNLRQAQEMLKYASAYAQIEKSTEGTLQSSAAGLLKNDLRQKAEGIILGVQEAATNIDVKAYAEQADAAVRNAAVMGAAGKGKPLSAQQQNQLTNIGALEDNIKQLKTMVQGKGGKEGIGSELLPTKDAKKAQAIAAAGQLLVKEAFNLGALDKDSAEYMERLYGGDPTQFRQEAYFERLAGLEQTVRAIKGRITGQTEKEEAAKQQLTQGWAPQ